MAKRGDDEITIWHSRVAHLLGGHSVLHVSLRVGIAYCGAITDKITKCKIVIFGQRLKANIVTVAEENEVGYWWNGSPRR